MLHSILVPSVEVIYVAKSCLAGIQTLAQSPAGRVGTKQIPFTKAADAAVPWTMPRDMCLSHT